MAVQLLNPDGLPQPEAYVQVAVATGTRTAYISGQVARDAAGNPVGTGDLAAQVSQAMRNVDTALRAVGATFEDVAKLTVFVVDWSPDKMESLVGGVMGVVEELSGSPVRPTTLIGVAALGEPDLLVEIEATAVLD